MNPKPNRAPASNCPDPKLQQAQKEIQEVFDRYDLGGAVILQSPSMAHFFMVIDPSWSCAFYAENQNMIRVKALRTDYPSKEAHAKALNQTAGMLISIGEISEILQKNTHAVLFMMSKKMEIDHKSDELPNNERFDLE